MTNPTHHQAQPSIVETHDTNDNGVADMIFVDYDGDGAGDGWQFDANEDQKTEAWAVDGNGDGNWEVDADETAHLS